jgi:cell division protein ZipA
MSELRWILMVASVVLLAWVYFQGRRKRFANVDAEPIAPRDLEPPRLSEVAIVRRRHREPSAAISSQANEIKTDDLPEVRITESAPKSLSMEAALSTSALEQLTIMQPLPVESPQPISVAVSPKPVVIVKPRAARKIVALRVAAGTYEFSGTYLNDWFVAHDLRFGKYDIYHRYDANGLTQFSVASMVEPGTFDRASMLTTHYPGVSLFLQLPDAMDGIAAFEAMLTCARALQTDFHGNLFGERNAPLTTEVVERMREGIFDFEHLLSVPRSNG